MIIACIISFIIGAFAMLCAIGLMSCQKDKKPQNNVHFYVARDKDDYSYLYLGKPIKKDNEFTGDLHNGVVMLTSYLKDFGLNNEDYKDLKWEDEPVEVFLNLED